MTNDFIFNTRLKELRIEKKLSQTDLANIINVSQPNIARWEQGIQIPNAESIFKLAIYFNISADFLLGIENDDGKIIVQEQKLPNDEENLLNNYRHLPNELKTMTQEYVKTLNNLNNEFYNNTIKKNA